MIIIIMFFSCSTTVLLVPAMTSCVPTTHFTTRPLSLVDSPTTWTVSVQKNTTTETTICGKRRPRLLQKLPRQRGGGPRLKKRIMKITTITMSTMMTKKRGGGGRPRGGATGGRTGGSLKRKMSEGFRIIEKDISL